MIAIDVVSVFRFNGTEGPVGTIKRLLKNRKYFLSHGFDITVFSNGLLYQNLSESNIKYTNEKSSKKRTILRCINNLSAKYYAASVIISELKFRHYKNIVDEYVLLNRNPDVVVFHEEMSCYNYLKHRREHKAKVVLFFHNDGRPFQMFKLYYPKIEGSWYMNQLMNRYSYTVQNVDQCAFICMAGLKETQKLYPVSIKKSSLVINGIDDLTEEEKEFVSQKRADNKDNIIRLCCVGSVSVRKGQRHIIESLTKLPNRIRTKYHLTIVGDGADMLYCKQLVEKYNLSERVCFAGSVPNKYIYKHLAEADVFILLSQNEGMPISIIEAMRAGLAIISTNVSGIPELVSKENGVLIDPTAEALLKILNDSEGYDWKALGRKSREIYEKKFTFDRMREDYKNMMLKVINIDNEI